MKKWVGIITVAVFAIIAVVDLIHDAISNNAISYFSEQPRRLLAVAAIGIAGGLLALVFERLSPRSRRSLKLYTLGSVASLLAIFSAYFLSQILTLSPYLAESVARRTIVLFPACLAAVSILLWLEFYQTFKRQVE